jgi:hypothetical protein
MMTRAWNARPIARDLAMGKKSLLIPKDIPGLGAAQRKSAMLILKDIPGLGVAERKTVVLILKDIPGLDR